MLGPCSVVVRLLRPALLVLCLSLPAAVDRAFAQQPPTSLTGHTGGVAALIFSPDGKTLATAGLDRTVRFWDPRSGSLLRTVSGPQQVLGLSVSADGRGLYSTTRDGAIQTWELFIPDPVQSLAGAQQNVHAVAIDGQGKWIAAAGDAGELKLWPQATGLTATAADAALTPVELAGHRATVRRLAVSKDNALLASGDDEGMLRIGPPIDPAAPNVPAPQVLGAHIGPVAGVAFHPTNPLMMSAGRDGVVKVWQLPLKAPLEMATADAPPRTAIPAVALSSDGKLALLGDAAKSVTLFDAATGLPVRSFAAPGTGADEAVVALRFSPDAVLAAAGTQTGSLRFWNIADGADRLALHGHAGPVQALAFHPQGQQVASAGADGVVRVWRLPTAGKLLTGHGQNLTAVAISADGKVAATASADKTVRLWNVADGAALRTIEGFSAAVEHLAFNRDATQLAAADSVGQIRIIKVSDGATLGAFAATDSPLAGIAWLPDGTQLVSSGTNGALNWWKLPQAPPRILAGPAVAVRAAALSSDNKIAAVAYADKSLQLYNPATGQAVRELKGLTAPATSVALSKDATLVAAGAEDGSILLWNAGDGVERGVLTGPTGAVTGVAFHPQGQQLATAGADGLARLWRLPNAPKRLAGHAQVLETIAYSPDGKLIATAGQDKTVRLWNAETGAAVRTLGGHAQTVAQVAFRKDGQQLASADAGGEVRFWNVADGVEQGRFMAQAGAVTGLAYTNDGKQIHTTGADGSLKTWSLPLAEPPAEPRTISASTAKLTGLAISSDGAKLLTSSEDTHARVWNTATGQALADLPAQVKVVSADLRGDGAQAATAGERRIEVWSLAPQVKSEGVIEVAAAVHDIRYSPDGTRLTAACEDRRLRIYDSQTRRLLEETLLEAPVRRVTFAPDGLQVAVAAAAMGEVHQVSLVRWIKAHAEGARDAIFAPDGGSLFTCGVDKTVKQWNLADGKLLRTCGGATDAVTGVALTADGGVLAGCSLDRSVYIWTLAAPANAQQPQALAATLATGQALHDVSLSADGKLIAAAGDAGFLQTWERGAGLAWERLSGHTGVVTSVALSADGTTLLSGGAELARISTLSAQRVLLASEKPLRAMALTTDGARIAVAGEGGEVRLFAAADGKPAGSIAVTGPIDTLAIRGDGMQLAAAGADKQLYICPLTPAGPGPCVKVPQEAAIAELVYNRDGTRLAAAGVDKLVRVVDPVDGRLLEALPTSVPSTSLAFVPQAGAATAGESLLLAENEVARLQPLGFLRALTGHEGAVSGLAWTPDGGRLVSGGADKTVRVWNLADGKQLAALAGPTAEVTSLTLSADGATTAAASSDKSAYLWKTPAAAVAQPVAATAVLAHSQPLRSVALTADGARLATASDDGRLRLWDVALARELERFEASTAGPSAITQIALSSDGRTMLTNRAADKSVRLWKPAVLRLWIADAKQLNDAVLTPDGSQIVTVGEDLPVKFWDLEGRPVKQLAGAQTPLVRVTVRNDSQQLAAVDAAGRLHLWMLADSKLSPLIETGAAIHDLAYSPDNLKLALAGADKQLRVVQPSDGQALQQWTATAAVQTVRFSPDSRHLLTGCEKQVQSWAYASPAMLRNVAGHNGGAYCAVASADDTWMATGGADATIRIWNPQTGAAVRQLSGHAGAVYALAASGDGRQLLSAGADGIVRLWDPASGGELKKFAPPKPPGAAASSETSASAASNAAPAKPAALYTAAFHSAGLVAAAGADGSITLWSAASGEVQRSLASEGGPVYRVVFNAEGNRLLSVDHVGRYTIWNLGDGQKLLSGTAPAVAYDAQYTRDGARLAIACADGRVHFIDLPVAAR